MPYFNRNWDVKRTGFCPTASYMIQHLIRTSGDNGILWVNTDLRMTLTEVSRGMQGHYKESLTEGLAGTGH